MKRRPSKSSPPAPPPVAIRHVVLVGLGNIGSAAASLIARLGIPQITLCDQGTFEEKDAAGQAIDRAATGRAKVDVIADRLKGINPALRMRAIHARLQDVPRGWLRADAMLCALDARAPRAYANQAARQLDTPVLIDAGVEPSQLLARVNVHRPSSSCLQCSWSDDDYQLIEARNPCAAQDTAPSTNAPAALGALAASMLAIELRKACDGDWGHVATGKQIIYCALTHRLITTEIGLNRQCRCDHTPWRIETLNESPARFTLADALRLGESLSVPGQPFISALACQTCGTRRKTLRLAGRLSGRQRTCKPCGTTMVAPGFDHLDRLDATSLARNASWLKRPLAALGIVEGDILCLRTADGERLLQVGAGANEACGNNAAERPSPQTSSGVPGESEMRDYCCTPPTMKRSAI